MLVSLQIFIGCLPLIVTSLVVLLRKKTYVIPAILIAASLGAAVFGLIRFDLGSEGSQSASSAAAVTKEQMLYLTCLETGNGDYEMAGEMAEQMYRKFGDDADGSLALARLKVLTGDIQAACALYQKAKTLDPELDLPEKEGEFFELALAGQILSAREAAEAEAEILYLTSLDADVKEYGYTYTVEELQANAASLEEFQQLVAEAAAEDAKDSGYSEESMKKADKILTASKTIAEGIEQYKTDSTYDEEAVRDAVKTVKNNISDVPEMASVPYVDENIVGGYLLTGNDEALVEYAQDTDSQTAYAAVTDLYLQDVISESDFPEDFVTLTEEEYEELAQQCEKIAEDLDFETEQEQEDVEAMIQSIKDKSDELILAELEYRTDPDYGIPEDPSKLYLTQSVIQFEMNNDNRAEESLSDAIATSVYSSDSEYSQALGMIASIINGTADSNEIKNAEEYLQKAYENSLPVYVENTGAQDEGEEGTEGETESRGGVSEEYLKGASNYVSTVRAMINISSIDPSGFPEVTFRLQTTRGLNLTDPGLTLADCNLTISDYTISEVTYDGAKVALVCDTSGSMGGSEEALREAVRKYLADMAQNEQVSIVSFDSGVNFVTDYMSTPEDFEEYISRLDANGGTNVASGVWAAIESMETTENVYRAVIVMTDGEDSSFSQGDLELLQERCEEAEITLYTIGIGSSIQADYLENIAWYGNGQFVYCSDISQLEALYEFIHSQIQHTYQITFQAINTDWADRWISVEDSANGGYAKKSYYIEETEEPDEDGAKITSIDTRSFYKTAASVTFQLLGSGFESGTNLSVNISGDMGRWNLEAVYVDENHIRVTIPGDVAIGEYHLVASADESVYEDDIELFGEYQTLTYGAYVFQAQKIKKGTDQTVLTGGVTLNDYIHFKGTVTLAGNVDKDTAVQLVDASGSYVQLSESSPGLLGSYYGDTITLLSLGTVTIYNDAAHLNDLNNYQVSSFPFSTICADGLELGDTEAAIYPHMISLKVAELVLDFPLQKEILSYAEADNPFSGRAELTAMIVPAGLRMKGEISFEKEKSLEFGAIPFNLKEFELTFDTWKNDYKLLMKISSDSLVPSIDSDDDSAFGFDIAITGGAYDSFHLYADVPVVVMAEPTITLSDFTAGIEDLASADQDSGFLNRLFSATFTGGCDVGVWRIADLIPAAAPIFDDLSLMSLEDCRVSLSVGNASFSINATLKVLDVDMGSATVKLGKMDYSNYLLGIDDKDVIGLYTKVAQGPDLDLGGFDMTVQGSTEIAILNNYAGIWSRGDVDYDIDFVIQKSNSLDGNMMIALHNNYRQLTILVKGTDLKKNKSAGVKITLTLGSLVPSISLY